MTILTAPALTQAIDTEASGTVELTVTPAITSNVRVLYRIRGATSWTDGSTFAGTAATQTTHNVTGLTDGEMYEFICTTENGGDTSQPSVAHRAQPTDGSGSIEEQAVAALKLALEGITITNGYEFDIGRVYRHEKVPDKLGLDGVTAFIFEQADTARVDGAIGEHQLIRSSKPLFIELASTRKGRSHGASSSESSKEAKRLYNAVGLAVGGDLILDNGGNRRVLFIEYQGHESFVGTEASTQVSIIARFLMHYRHRSDNPSLRI